MKPTIDIETDPLKKQSKNRYKSRMTEKNKEKTKSKSKDKSRCRYKRKRIDKMRKRDNNSLIMTKSSKIQELNWIF